MSRRCSGLLFALVLALLVCLAQSQGTCSSTQPCAQGCCSKTGYCGFGPNYCNATNCISSCNAQAECGQYAPAGQTNCPLNVCCSQYGFCGTTSEFCGTGCQNGCAAPVKPTCASGGSAYKKRIGYYESWSVTRACDQVQIGAIDPTLWTHLNYAFALIDPNSYQIAVANASDPQNYLSFVDLKKRSPGLSVYLSVGGWDAGGAVWSQMVSTSARRAAFISSSLQLLRTFGFDGIDLDWEYPAASDRGGSAADFANYVSLLAEMRAAYGSKGITVTLPTSYWYLKGFDIKNLLPYVDWFNLMSYDIHGTWDGANPYTTKTVAPHTNLTEIDQALNLLWRNNIPPSKVVLGLGFYGRSFTLANPACNTPGCPFSGGANAGACTGQAGILSFAEIQRVIANHSLTPTLDKAAAVKYMTWNSDQWVSYDDGDTFKMKLDYANNLCLAGTMVWAIDLDSPSSSLAAQYLSFGGNTTVDNGWSPVKVKAVSNQNTITASAFMTQCATDPSCPPNYYEATRAYGSYNSADKEYCKSGETRLVCVPRNVQVSGCAWNTNDVGTHFTCSGSCPKGTLLMTMNDSPSADPRDECYGGDFAAYCCQSIVVYDVQICPPTTISIFLGGLANAYSYQTRPYDTPQQKRKRDELAAEDQGFGSGPPANRKRDTINGLNYGPNCLVKRDPQNNSGQLAQPQPYALGGAGFVYGAMGPPPVGAGGSGPGGSYPKLPLPTIRVDGKTVRRFNENPIVVTKTCDGAKYPQPCAHYRSVQSVIPEYSTLTCGYISWNDYRPAAREYRNQRDDAWFNWLPKSYNEPEFGNHIAVDPEADEYPFHIFNPGYNVGAPIRLVPQRQNSGAGQLANGICVYAADHFAQTVGIALSERTQIFPNMVVISVDTTIDHLANRLAVKFSNMPVNQYDPDLINANVCWPQTLYPNAAPGFALRNEDAYFWSGSGQDQRRYVVVYAFAPDASITNGKTPPTRRSVDFNGNPVGEMVADMGNSSRRLTDEELMRDHHIIRCKSDCTQEQSTISSLRDLAYSLRLAKTDKMPPTTLLTVMSVTEAWSPLATVTDSATVTRGPAIPARVMNGVEAIRTPSMVQELV